MAFHAGRSHTLADFIAVFGLAEAGHRPFYRRKYRFIGFDVAVKYSISTAQAAVFIMNLLQQQLPLSIDITAARRHRWPGDGGYPASADAAISWPAS